jgi:HK97 family phage major capsid protein
MSTSGIGDLNAAYWTANPLPTAGAAANKLDRIRRGRKYVAVTGLAQATFVVLNPDDLEQIDELKDTTGKYVVGDPVSYTPVPRLWGLTVVESTSIAANSFLVGDGRMAAIYDRMDATIYMADQHGDFFIRNIFVLLAEERIALAVYRPAAFAKGILS